jgi:hypothetical protein
MADRKAFLLRLPADLLDELNRWARDDLRSLNGQIEFVLRDALRRRGRKTPPLPSSAAASSEGTGTQETRPEAPRLVDDG